MESNQSLMDIYHLDDEAKNRIEQAIKDIGEIVLASDHHAEVVEKLRDMAAQMDFTEFLIAVSVSFKTLMLFAETGYGENLPPELKFVH